MKPTPTSLPVFSLRKPSDDVVRRVLAEQRDLPLTYAGVGATRSGILEGYPINHHRVRLGHGPERFARAVDALKTWEMYRLDWTELCWPDIPVEPGKVVAVRVRHLGLWSVNPCRIVYVFEEEGEVDRVGFAIGTLPGHAEVGEERFTVERHRLDGSVWFEVFACAGAHHWMVKLGYPALRLIQHRFGRDALQAMHSAVGASTPR